MDETKKLISLAHDECPECNKRIRVPNIFERDEDKIETTMWCPECNKYYIVRSHIIHALQYNWEEDYDDYDMDNPVDYDDYTEDLDDYLCSIEDDADIEYRENEGSLYYNVMGEWNDEPIWYQLHVKVDEIEEVDDDDEEN